MQWWRHLRVFEAGSGSGRVRWRGKGSAFDGCVRRERYALGGSAFAGFVFQHGSARGFMLSG